ncbi:MAG: acyltransferase [Pseudomonadota bacterium]
MKREYEYLNLARFLAALWVLLFHANIHFGQLEPLSFINPILNEGVLGMTVFFILSGFVLAMCYSSFKEKGTAQSFYLARVIRLYPVYLVMGVVTFPTIFMTAEGYLFYEYYTVIWIAMIIGIFLLAIQAWAPALFSVWNFGGSWSLSVEAFFYATFPKLRDYLTKLSKENLIIIIFACIIIMFTILSLLIAQEGENSQQVIFYVLPVFRYPEFILGAVVFILCVERKSYRELLTKLSIPAFIIGLILIYTIELPGYLDFGFLFALPIAMIFVKTLELKASEFTSKIFNYLGHISYCLYLVQFGTAPYLISVLGDASLLESWLAFIAMTFIAANLLHFLIEVPAHSFLKKKLVERSLMKVR